MQSIGLSVEEIAIVYLALPLTTFLAPPVSGTYLKSYQALCSKLSIFKIIHNNLL